MTKDEAIYSFYSGFGLPAYDENTVPEGSALPYITYSVSTDSIGNMVILSASLWYRSTSWAAIQDKADEIAATLGHGGKIIKIDNGYLWLVKGSPFAQRMSEPSDKMVRRIIININAEFLTEI